VNDHARVQELRNSSGPLLQTFGRYLTLRPDLIRPGWLKLLLINSHQTPVLGVSMVSEILVRELGPETASQFRQIEACPVAATFGTQTHVAILSDGSHVLVKVARQRMPEFLAAQSTLTRELVRQGVVADRRAADEIVFEAEAWLQSELDLRREMEILQRLRNRMGDTDDEVLPKPYSDLCGPRVLTTERLSSKPLTALVGPGNLVSETNAKISEKLARCFVRRLFRAGTLYRGLHPDRILALDEGRISFCDFALDAEIDEDERQRQLHFLYSVYKGDLNSVSRGFTENLLLGEESDLESFRRHWLSAARDHAPEADQRLDSGGVPVSRSTAAHWLISLLRVSAEHGMQLPSSVASLYRTLLVLEDLMRMLDRQNKPECIIRELLADERQEEALRLLEPENLQDLLVSHVNMWRDSPRDLHQILAQLSDGSFRLRTYASEASSVLRARYRSAQMITTAILCVCVAVLLTMPGRPSVFGLRLVWPLWLLLGGLFVAVWLQWIRMR
jgi:ubiquinone biosynthesis protein